MFNDQPECFPVWKASFLNISQDLGVNSREELDLLVKWLGPDSTKQAQSIRIANAGDPTEALRKVWERLDERFESPELIETALKQKLENFPKLSTKDSRKLYELSDLLSEVASIKDNPAYASLLSYFNTSAGVNPVIEKLHYNIQMKRMDRASRYKRDHSVPFPPFSMFLTFVKDITKMMNDPCFLHEKRETQTTNTPRQSSKPVLRIAKTVTDSSTYQVCPLHNTGHSLNQCKTFRQKPI
jgi:hypothetical protein